MSILQKSKNGQKIDEIEINFVYLQVYLIMIYCFDVDFKEIYI